MISCPKCKTKLMATSGLIERSWVRCLYLVGIVVCWALLTVIGPVLFPPDPKRDYGVSQSVIWLLTGWVPGMVVALPFMLIGYGIGVRVAKGLDAPRSL